jgi:hypothetical protein
MHNLKNNALFFITVFLFLAGASRAAILVSFDKPNLIVVFDKKGTYGYYTDVSIKPSAFTDTERYECTFMFKRVAGPDEVSLRSLNRPIKDWDSAPYAEGSIRIDGLIWQIRFANRPRGCSGKYDHYEIVVPPGGPGLNATEYGARGAYFRVVKKTKVIGIRWVGFETFIQRKIKGKFVSTGEELGVATVVVLHRIGAFSEIEYVDLNTGNRVRGWVQSIKLSDPYPRD